MDTTMTETQPDPTAVDTEVPPLLELAGIGHEFGRRPGRSGVRAVDDISLSLNPGETVGLVGESGCGKSTLGRIATRLYRPTRGAVRFEGKDMTHQPKSADLKAFRRAVQMVFQDPNGSLNPRLPVGASIEEPLRARGVARADRRERLAEVLAEVGLDASAAARYPHEFSGGQRQRLALARALAPQPSVIVLDEPTSALDVSIQAQILNLLADLQDSLGLTYLFIAHDLSVVEHVSDRVAVMYLGRIVELADVAQLYSRPRHPYSAALLSAGSIADPDLADRRERIVLTGDVPSPVAPPSGCHFHPRCPKAQEICSREAPKLVVRDGDPETHRTACHFPVEPGDDLTGGPGGGH
jgi:peptide/nickel transport system ATP-binding protein